MSEAPKNPRLISFVDGQNLFNAAKEAFGYPFPNYNVLQLSKKISEENGWDLIETRFYTGIPEKADHRHRFWQNKLSSMGRQGITLFTRSLRYHFEEVQCPDGNVIGARVPTEKGIDVRIALDVIRLAFANRFDVGLLFSQDQDYSEVAKEIRSISRATHRWIKLVSAFPVSPTSTNTRGINGMDWIVIDKATYDECIDPADYR
jgi:uncharacterized LabA/DUF88 family protein